MTDLQEAVIVTLNDFPVAWPKNTTMANSIGHVLHPATLYEQLTGASCEVYVKLALTRRALKFLRHQKTISSGDGKPSVVDVKYEGLEDVARWSM